MEIDQLRDLFLYTQAQKEKNDYAAHPAVCKFFRALKPFDAIPSSFIRSLDADCHFPSPTPVTMFRLP